MKKCLLCVSLLFVIPCVACDSCDIEVTRAVRCLQEDLSGEQNSTLEASDDITPRALFEAEYPDELEPKKHEASSWIKIKTQHYGVAVLTAYLACKEKATGWFDYLYTGAKDSAQGAYDYLLSFFKK